ncbi:MAG: alpha/beta hydrolase [Phycisphaerae bacterium]
MLWGMTQARTWGGAVRPRFILLAVATLWGCAVAQQVADPGAASDGSAMSNQAIDPSTCMWFSSPAAKWDEALPVGNGRLGAMVFGTVQEERIQLNESTYWTGGPYSTVVAGGRTALPEIQRLVFAGDHFAAHKLFGRAMMGYPVEQQKYQSLANLHLSFAHGGEATGYRRAIDLATGVSIVEYTIDGVLYRREVLASAPDHAIIVRLTASRPGSLTLTVNLRGVRNQAHSNYATDYFRMDAVGDDGLAVTGKSADYLGIAGRVKFEARIKASNEGGSMRTAGADLVIDKADAVTLVFVARTNFVNYKDVSADEHARVESDLRHLQGKSYAELAGAGVADHARWFERAALRLPPTEQSYFATTERKEKYQSGSDSNLAALAYNFGRYVLIASSRPGSQPANLQGIWNDDMNPMWDSKYTTNINTEMNYWPAETANAGDLAQPLFNLIRQVADQGALVAKEHYGARGWVFHQNTDLWRVAAPMDGPSWGTFSVGGAWLCTHLWEHYEYTRDAEFLREYFPIIEGSVEFFLDVLVKEPGGRWLVTNPSTSPENFPDRGGNGPFFDEVTGARLAGTTICAGSSIDLQILDDLFGYYIRACEVLGERSPVLERVREARAHLAPPQIGADGLLQEWVDDWKSLEKEHRHVSHLYGLYPGRVLWDKRTPELVGACRKVLEDRGDGGMGFSMAWKMALWARLGEGNRANRVFSRYLREQSCPQLLARCGKALQVDGTLGVTAAITEMLLQSHDGCIHLLPALPDDWKSGEFNGVCARGAFELDFSWTQGVVDRARIRSKAGEICRIKVGKPVTVLCRGLAVECTSPADGIVEFATAKGETYELTTR